VLDRIVDILNCFSDQHAERSFTDIICQVRLNKSTVYRLLEAMREYDLIATDRSTGKYFLGMRLFELGMVSIGRLEIGKVATPLLETLVDRVGETAHLGVLDGYEAVYIAKVESRLPFRIPSDIGRRYPAYCTGVGKALLAHLPEEKLESYLTHTPLRGFTRNTITSPIELKRHFQQIRTQGYAIDNQEIDEGLRCVGAPIRDHSGKVVAAISIAGSATRITKRNVREMASYVIATAESISRQLGYGSNGARDAEPHVSIRKRPNAINRSGSRSAKSRK
jgi:IclR family KDG regulon transcriptional repressor